MNEYTITWTTVVEAEDEEDALTTARQLLADDDFEPTTILCFALAYDEGVPSA